MALLPNPEFFYMQVRSTIYYRYVLETEYNYMAMGHVQLGTIQSFSVPKYALNLPNLGTSL